MANRDDATAFAGLVLVVLLLLVVGGMVIAAVQIGTALGAFLGHVMPVVP